MENLRFGGGGRDEVLELVRSLDTRYLGALIVGSSDEIPALSDWIGNLSSFAKRVVWFDGYGENKPLPSADRHVVRCFFDETSRIAAIRAWRPVLVGRKASGL